MKRCPCCGFSEGPQVFQAHRYVKAGEFRCKACGAVGPISKRSKGKRCPRCEQLWQANRLNKNNKKHRAKRRILGLVSMLPTASLILRHRARVSGLHL